MFFPTEQGRTPWLVRLKRGWNPSQLYRDYNKPYKGSLLNNQDFIESRYSTEWGIFRLGLTISLVICLVKAAKRKRITEPNCCVGNNHWSQLRWYMFFLCLLWIGNELYRMKLNEFPPQQRRGTLRITGNPAKKRGPKDVFLLAEVWNPQTTSDLRSRLILRAWNVSSKVFFLPEVLRYMICSGSSPFPINI